MRRMFSVLFLLAVFTMVFSTFGLAQDQAVADGSTGGEALFHLGGTAVTGYVGADVSYTRIFHDDAALMSVRVAAILNGRWAVGLRGSAMLYDKKLYDLGNGEPYHFNLSYGGLYVEHIVPIGNDVRLSLSILTGAGTAEYLYDRVYRSDKVWTEEVIDRTNFAVFEPGIALDIRLGAHWWIGAHASVRNTSPIDLKGTSENVFRTSSTGITFKYGLL